MHLYGEPSPKEGSRELEYFQSTAELLAEAKNHPVHVDPNIVLEKVQELTMLWRACCEGMGEAKTQLNRLLVIRLQFRLAQLSQTPLLVTLLPRSKMSILDDWRTLTDL
jgi:hypothetical protein